jgi:enoyl-CoA hydratase
MKPGLQPGITAQLGWSVDATNSIHLGETSPAGTIVFSTPSMINLMEHAARKALLPFLEEGEESVGVTVEVHHTAATPLGAQVMADATVTSVDGRLVDFEVVARDGIEQIGHGKHRRAIIRMDRLQEKLREKVSENELPEMNMSTSCLEPNRGELSPLETLSVSVTGAVVTITLNRPRKLNAVNLQMTADWERVNAWLGGHPELRIAIVTGAGDAFCAGDDVPEVGTLTADQARQLSHRQARMYLAWERLPQVLIGAINGSAFGAGCVAAYSCDLRVCASGAELGMPEITLGWSPGYGLAQLTAIVGKAKALELCLTGNSISAQKALQWGLVNEVVPLARLMTSVNLLADRLLGQPLEALRATKRAIHRDEPLSAKVAYLADTEAYISCLETSNAVEGIAAFREKRAPRFRDS